MSFIRNIIKGAEFRSGLANPESWLADALAGGHTASGQRVTWRSAMGLSPVFAAVSMISDAVGRMPLKVYREIDDDERVEARQHRAWSMLHDSPNPHTPAQRFWSTVTAQLLLWGNVFVVKNRTDGILVDELYLLDPASTLVYWDDRTKTKTFVQEAGSVPGASEPRRRTWTQDEVLHIFGLSLNGVTGVSRIEWCRNMLGNAQARESFEGRFWDHGAVFSGVLQRPIGTPELSELARKNLASSFSAKYAGPSRKGFEIPILEEGTTFQPGSMPLDDAQFVESQQMSRTDIAILFNLPPAYLGGSTGDSLTYATVESNQLQFIQHAVMPWTATIENALITDPSIFPQSVFYPEFLMDALLRADAQSRADYYVKMSSVKAITVNEIRGKENMPPLPGGDEIGSSIPETARETIPDPQAGVTGTGVTNGNATPAQIAAVVNAANGSSGNGTSSN